MSYLTTDDGFRLYYEEVGSGYSESPTFSTMQVRKPALRICGGCEGPRRRTGALRSWRWSDAVSSRGSPCWSPSLRACARCWLVCLMLS